MRAIAAQLVLAPLAAACGLAFAPAFGGRLTAGDFAPGALVAAVLAGAFVPALIVVIARRLRGDAVPAAAAGLAGTAVAVVAVTRPGTAAFSGGYRLLSAALPAAADGPGCFTIAALTAVASLVGALVAGYARVRAVAVLPALGCFLAALALDAGAAEPPGWYAAVLLVLLGGALALLREPVERAAFSLAGAAAIVAVAVTAATTLATALPGVTRRAADARNLVAPPLQARNAVNPMLQYPALALGVDRLSLHGTSSRRLSQLTLVTLSGFTGQIWTTAAHFRRAGRILRLEPAAAPVTVDVTVGDARTLSWLVRPDRPTSIDQDGLGFDEATGDVVVPAGAAYPTRYRVTGTLPMRPSDSLAADHAVPRTGPVSAGTARVPASVRALAVRAKIERTDHLKLAALQALLRGDGFFADNTTTAPSGSGYYQIDRLLRAARQHVGTSEQFASAFAVLARVLGFESRLVLGFRPRYALRGNSFAVTGRDIHAWAQVHFARAGWVTFDPTPTRLVSQVPPRQPPAGTNGSPTTLPSSAGPLPVPSTSRSAHAQRRPASSADVLPLLLGAAGALVVVLVATPPSVKARRRRGRRRAARPAHAVDGAWRETTDRLVEAGVARSRSRFTSEVAAQSPAVVRHDVRELGRLVDRARYAPGEPPLDDARAAWQHADAATRTLRARMSPLRRVLAALDPRPLRRR